MWMLQACLSALLLGGYDISKKVSVAGNAVLPTLFTTTLAGSLCLAPVFVLSALFPEQALRWGIHLPPQPLAAHLLILLKSSIVGCSWVLSYFALKHLPLTLATPLRATGPLFTVLGAVLLFDERPSPFQWGGISLILAAYFLLSLSARTRPRDESGSAAPWPWILMMIAAALTGAASAGFDKYLLQDRGLPPLFVLGLFLPYLALLLGMVLLLAWFPNRARLTRFRFRPSMGLVGALLVASDFAYFSALAQPEAKLSLISAIRRTNVIVSFAGGALLFRESKSLRRLLPFAAILSGLTLLLLG
jgi:drug/metabolite transporter (DMT)-like permease